MKKSESHIYIDESNQMVFSKVLNDLFTYLKEYFVNGNIYVYDKFKNEIYHNEEMNLFEQYLLFYFDIAKNEKSATTVSCLLDSKIHFYLSNKKLNYTDICFLNYIKSSVLLIYGNKFKKFETFTSDFSNIVLDCCEDLNLFHYEITNLNSEISSLIKNNK